MGDGQHVWAAAEWLMAIRNMFVREEGKTLVIGSGIPNHWHYADERISYGPTWTPWGKLSIAIQFRTETADVSWEADWHRTSPNVLVSVPCFGALDVDMSQLTGSVTVHSNHTCNRELVN